MNRVTQADLDIFTQPKRIQGTIKISELKDKSDRTLLLGLDMYQDTISVKIVRHVYLEGGKLHLNLYKVWSNTQFVQLEHFIADELNIDDFTSRLTTLPTGTDKEIALMLFELGVNLKYATINSSNAIIGERVQNKFVALTHEELQKLL